MSAPRHLPFYRNKQPPPRLRPAYDCASCHLRRRHCDLNCVMAPYFPASMAEEFANVHNHFKFDYIEEQLTYLRPHLRRDFVNSVIYEANCRAHNAVGGCVPIIGKLQQDIESLEEELRIITQQLAYHQMATSYYHPFY